MINLIERQRRQLRVPVESRRAPSRTSSRDRTASTGTQTLGKTTYPDVHCGRTTSTTRTWATKTSSILATTRPGPPSAIRATSSGAMSRASTSPASTRARTRSWSRARCRARSRGPPVQGRRRAPAARVEFGIPGHLAFTTVGGVEHARAARSTSRPTIRASRSTSRHRRGLRPGPDRVERPRRARRAALRLLRCALDAAERSREPGQHDRRVPRRRPECRRRQDLVLAAARGLLSGRRRARRCSSPTGTSSSIPALGDDLHERRLRHARGPPGRRASTSACSAIPTSSPRRPCSTSSATSRRSPTGSASTSDVLQGHPRPAGRRVHLDLQRRRVRAAHQRRLRRRARASRWRSTQRTSARSRSRSTTPGSGARELERSARDRDARRGGRGPAAADHPVQLGPAPHAQPDAHAMQRPGEFSASAILRAASGQPYTPMIETGFGVGSRPTRAASRPASLVDLRGEKPLALGGRRCQPRSAASSTCSTRASSTASCSRSTGSPYYSRFPEADGVTLARSDALLRAAPDRDRARRLGAEGRRVMRRMSARLRRRALAARRWPSRCRRARDVPTPVPARPARPHRCRALRAPRRHQHPHRLLELRHGRRLPARPRQRRPQRVPLRRGARRAAA